MGFFDKIFDNDKNADEQKRKADFSNVQSGSSSTAPAPPREVEVRTYTVVAGDSLSKIAQREYGDASKWRAIHQANRESIPNPDLIHPGQVLVLPSNP